MIFPYETIVGNLTADPKLRTTGNGSKVVNFRIAVNQRRRNKQTNQWEDGDVWFLNCNAWDGEHHMLASNIAASLRKGMPVIACGRLHQREYQAKDGSSRSVVEMTVDHIGPDLRKSTVAVNRQQQPAQQQNGWGTPAAIPNDARSEDALLDAWRPADDDLARAAELGVDGDTLADKMRDKLTRKGFDACDIRRRTPQALDAMFRTWVEHEAQWTGERPKPVTQPDRHKIADACLSWCSPEVRALMDPYRGRFRPNTSLGPNKAWYEARKAVAERLNAGEPPENIAADLAARYGTPAAQMP